MNTNEIASLLSANVYTAERFKGVYPYDKIPILNDVKKECCFVFNLDPSTRNGSHWVAVMLHPTKRNVYFDSYGWPPFKNRLKNLMVKCGDFDYNSQQLQHSFSTTCGQWCMYFIHEHCRGLSLKELIANFSKEYLLANDHVLNALVENAFDTDQDVIDKGFLKDQLCLQTCKTLASNSKALCPHGRDKWKSTR